MANPMKGEASFAAGGKVYTVRFDFDTLVRIEDITGESIDVTFGLLQDPKAPKLGRIRAVVCGVLQATTPDMTLDRAGQIVQEAGLPAIQEAIILAGRRSFDQGEASDNTPPPKAPNGTGAVSKPKPSKLASASKNSGARPQRN